MEPLLSPIEAASRLGITPRALLSATRAGRIGCVRLSRKLIRFRESELTAYVERSAAPARPARNSPPVIAPPLTENAIDRPTPCGVTSKVIDDSTQSLKALRAELRRL